MKKKTVSKKKTLKFENNFRVLSNKHGGYVLIFTENGSCITISALKILRQALISLSIKEREEKINEAA